MPTQEIRIRSITLSVPAQQAALTTVTCAMQTGTFEKNLIISYVVVGTMNDYLYPVFENNGISIELPFVTFSGTEATQSIQIFGNPTNPRIEYGKTYTLVRFQPSSIDTPLLLTKNFKLEVPTEKPRLASASVTSSSDRLSCSITFTTRLLEVGATYNIRMTGTSTSGTGSEHAGCVTATVSTISSGQRAVATARLSEDGKNADLINGYTYVPKEVVKTSGKTEANIIIDNFVVKTPSGAPKVTSVKAYFKSGSYEWQLIIEFGGSGLGSLAGQRVTVNDGTKNIELQDTLYFSSDSVGTINVNLSGSSPQLKYGKTCSVVKMEPSSSGDTPALKKGLRFEIPKEKPHLLGVSRQTNATDGKSTTLTFDSSKLEEGETYDITLSGTPSTTNHTAILTVVASTTSGTQKATGTAILSPPKENSLWHGMTYTPISMKKVNSEMEHSSVVTHPFTFMTPPDNRKVSSCRVGFTDLSQKTLKITLDGVNLPTDSEFVVMIDAITPFDLKESGVFSSTSEGSIVATTFKRGQTPELEYGKTYTIKAMRYKANGAPVVLSSPLSISIPVSTPQILEATCQFDASSNTAIITLYGNKLKTAEMTVGVSDKKGVRVTSTTKTRFNENTKTLSVIFSTSEESKADCLVFGQSYTVKVVGGGRKESMPVFDGVSFKLTHTPKITHVDFAFTNKMGTTAQLTLSGTDFPENEVLTATITGGISFIVTRADDNTAVSEPIVIGFDNTLEYETEYAFVSLTLPGDDFNMFDVSSSTFVTDARPAQSVFVVEEGDDEEKDCGEETKPCGSIETVIELSEEMGMMKLAIDLKGEISQTTTITIPERSSLTLQNFRRSESTLLVPRSATPGEKKGLVLVYKASLALKDLTVAIDGSTGVTCLVFGMGSSFNVEHCSVFVEKTELAQEINSNEVLCSWKTGLFILEKSTISFISSSFEDIEQGVVDMNGGSLVVQNCTFHKNGKVLDGFPSMRQNIECRNEATINITTSQSTDEPLWIAADNCTVVKDSIEIKAPMFIPSINEKTTKVVFDTENDQFVVIMKGTLLIPCDLKLEIFEVFPHKKTETGKHKLIELTGANTADWTETGFVATILHSQLKPDLDVKKDWHMALSFGHHVRSSTSIKIKDHTKTAATMIAIIVPTIVFVLFCVVVGCIVGCVCVRRRKFQQVKYAHFQNVVSEGQTPSQGDLTVGDNSVKGSGVSNDVLSGGSTELPELDVVEGKD